MERNGVGMKANQERIMHVITDLNLYIMFTSWTKGKFIERNVIS